MKKSLHSLLFLILSISPTLAAANQGSENTMQEQIGPTIDIVRQNSVLWALASYVVNNNATNGTIITAQPTLRQFLGEKLPENKSRFVVRAAVSLKGRALNREVELALSESCQNEATKAVFAFPNYGTKDDHEKLKAETPKVYRDQALLTLLNDFLRLQAARDALRASSLYDEANLYKMSDSELIELIIKDPSKKTEFELAISRKTTKDGWKVAGPYVLLRQEVSAEGLLTLIGKYKNTADFIQTHQCNSI